MKMLVAELLARRPVITDGALGTQLQARGLTTGECPDAWNLSHADRVEALARAYVEAGSDIILANTFRANRVALAGYGLADRVEEINRAGIEIARRAAAGRAKVFASCGPSGKMLMTAKSAKMTCGRRLPSRRGWRLRLALTGSPSRPWPTWLRRSWLWLPRVR